MTSYSELSEQITNKFRKFSNKKDPQFQADATKSKITDFKPVKFKGVKEEVKDFIEFIGFRGYYDKRGYPIIDLSYTMEVVRKNNPNIVITSIDYETKPNIHNKNYPSIEKVYIHEFHEGKAHPPPIDEKDDKLGILPHEVEGFKLIRKYLKKGIMFKWPRGFGKTYLACWFIEWSMLRLGFPWLYLSETAIMNDVAYWIWQWAKKQKLIINAQKGDKQNTYTQFELKTGAVLRIFKYMDEAPTGQHGWYLALDDFIKRGWADRPSDNERAKRQWNYVHNFIRRIGLMAFGTRKFPDDPIEHLETVVSGMHVEVKTPYIMDGEFPDWKITYDENEREVLWVPELYNHEELEEKKASIAEESDEDPIIAWMAEMMQDPRPSAGGLCSPEDIYYTKRPMFYENVQMVGIGVDLAWEDTKNTSDMCAVGSCIMHKIQVKKKWYKRFTFVRAEVYRMPLYNTVRDGKMIKGVFTIIGEQWIWLKRQYPHIPLIIAIERNSGGMVIIKVAQREGFKWIGNVIPDRKVAIKLKKPGHVNIPLGITHKKNKVSRVYGELHNSIRDVPKEHAGHEVQFDWSLEGSTLISQLCGFPKAKHDDGPDMAGMIKDELNARYSPTVKPRMSRDDLADIKKQKVHADKFRERQQPWLEDVKRLKGFDRGNRRLRQK